MLASKISIILAKNNLELELEAHTLCRGASYQFYLLANFELLTPTLNVKTRKYLVHHLHQNRRLALNSCHAYCGKGCRYQVLVLYTRHNFYTGPFDFLFTQLGLWVVSLDIAKVICIILYISHFSVR